METAAASTTSVGTNPPVDATSDAPPSAGQTTTEDIELDLGDGVKAKQSEVYKTFRSAKEIERGANKKFEEASKIRKESQAQAEAREKAFIERLKANPRQTLREVGIDVRGMSEQELTEAIEEAQLTPDQRELRALKKENDDFKKQQAKEKEDRDQQAHAAQVQQNIQQYDQAFAEAMTQVGLPRTEGTVLRMAQLVDSYLAAGKTDVTLVDIAKRLKSHDLHQEHQQYLESLSDEELLGMLPERVIKTVQQSLIRKARGEQQQPQTPKPQTKERAERIPRNGPVDEFQARELVARALRGS